MTQIICGNSGLVLCAERKILAGLHPAVRPKFILIMDRLRQYLKKSRLALCAPPSEQWLTVKLRPKKAVLAFVDQSDGKFKFDIDTYAHDDISDERGLMELMPIEEKPNKRYVGYVSPTSPDDELEYFIRKMIEGMQKFERI